MNEDGGNAGGYSQSDLKKWIDSELYNMFPAVLKQRMTGLSIPTLGEICAGPINGIEITSKRMAMSSFLL